RTADDPIIQKRIEKQVRKARRNTSEHVFEKITRSVNGKPQIVLEPPLLYRPRDYERIVREDVEPFFERYRSTMSADRRALFDRFRLADVAGKVVGVGSVGTRCYIALFMGDQDDPLFLQVKEARSSVLAGRVPQRIDAHNGERVVTGQRLMQ